MKVVIALTFAVLSIYLRADGVPVKKLKEPVFTSTTVREFQRKAESNDPEGMYLYAKALCFGLGIEEDHEKGFVFAQKSAEQNFAAGVNLLALCYLNGWGVETDCFKGAKLLKQAVSMGDVKAKANLAGCYLRGDGVPKDVDKALKMYEDAANAGVIFAMTELGRYYSEHYDDDSAFKWFALSSKMDDEYGKVRLASCYVLGKGCERDIAKAIEMLEPLAANANCIAEWWLGKLYERGCGYEKDVEQALVWYRRAAAHGHEDAPKQIKRIEDKYYSKKTIATQNGFACGGVEPDSFCGFTFGMVIGGSYGEAPHRADDGSACIEHCRLKKPFRKFHDDARLYGCIASKRLFKIEMYSESFSEDVTKEDREKEYEATKNVLSKFYRIKPNESREKSLSIASRGGTLGSITDISWNQRIAVYELGRVVITLRWAGEDRMWLTAVHTNLEKQAKDEAEKEMKEADGSEAL